MLRVGFDDQIFEAQLRGGVSRAFVEIITRLPDHGIEPVVLARTTRNQHLAESGLVPTAAPRGALGRALHWGAWRLAGRPAVSPAEASIDVLHHTFTHPGYLASWSGPRVVTIHDMTPELFPELFPLGNPHFAKRRYARVADAVIAISESTAKDLARLYADDPPPHVDVVPHGVDARFFGESGPRLALPERYLLFVGVRGGYKSFPLALEAFGELAHEDPDLWFVVVGGGEFTRRERALLRDSGVESRIVRATPRDAEMPAVYRGALAFAFPSAYEGFGLPTLEALASGTPTVLADASSSREVGGDAARYFAPGDGAGLTSALREAMTAQAREWAALVGPARARAFDWDVTAARHADVYRAVAERARAGRG